ncbi:hypothetical protein DMC64_36415 [Amycolatopsis sp. WAC 04197]|nr:hypothetical protein DMC64_36415 [Amycolatopsis sp. WAC 04197]
MTGKSLRRHGKLAVGQKAVVTYSVTVMSNPNGALRSGPWPASALAVRCGCTGVSLRASDGRFHTRLAPTRAACSSPEPGSDRPGQRHPHATPKMPSPCSVRLHNTSTLQRVTN